jgi:ammonia channel protein AmtB
MFASFGGGAASLSFSLIKNKGKLEPGDMVNGILGGLVGITGEINFIYFI